MKLKRTVFLQTVVVALGLLLGTSAASGAVPEPATLISPSGPITDNTPTYTWNAVTDSTWYLLWVWDSTETKKLLQWYTAEEAGCSDGTGECSVTPETMMAGDSHEWWIRTWNDDGRGDWSDELSFTIPPAPVPQTGQTRSDAAGDDGDLQKGVPWPEPRFTDNGNGTVTDHLTGLIWTTSTPCSSLSSWADALLYVAEDVHDGKCLIDDGSQPGDWRLPNVRELQSLLDFGRTAPPLPSGHPFDFDGDDHGGYWTSTPGSCIPLTPNCWDDMAWVVFININAPDATVLCKKEDPDIPGQSRCEITRPEFGGFGRIWPVRGGN